MRKAKIWMHDKLAGYLTEDDEGYAFSYDAGYLKSSDPEPVSLTLPITSKGHRSRVLFPFFDGLIPEGWLLGIAEKNWKLKESDRMGLLLACCRDCIGAVSIQEEN
jgi:serine/threonine-protein kinase HipA